MGEGRCGSPAAVDSWRPGAFAMKPFAPDASAVHDATEPRTSGRVGDLAHVASVSAGLPTSDPCLRCAVSSSDPRARGRGRRRSRARDAPIAAACRRPRARVRRAVADVGRVVGAGWDRDEWDACDGAHGIATSWDGRGDRMAATCDAPSALSTAICAIRAAAGSSTGSRLTAARVPTATATRPYVHRAPRRVGVQLSPGRLLPETLVERAAALGYPALALLDADGVYGAPRFHKAAQRAGLRAIIGAELTIEAGTAVRRRRCHGSRDAEAEHSASPAPAGRCPCWSRATAALPRPRRLADGLPEPLSPVTRMKMRAPKGEGALALEELDGFTPASSRSPAGRMLDARHTASAACSIGSSGSSGATNVYVELQRHLLRDEESDNAALDGSWPRRFACRSSPPTACASPSRPSGRCSTCSPACTTTPRSTPPAGCWRATPSGI